MSILIFLLVLSVLVFLHELGHFLVAKRYGIRVLEFGLGYPPRMLRLARRGETDYTLNWIPFGGFVRMLGEDDPSLPGSLASKAPGARAAVLLAGSAMNALLGLGVFFFVSLLTPHFQYAGGVIVRSVSEGSPAAEAGLRPGDRIVALGEEPISSYPVLRRELGEHLGQPVTLTVERQGERITGVLVPRRNPPPGQGAIGVMLEAPAGMVVTGVRPGSPAWEAGIRPGDAILNVGGERFTDPRELQGFLEERRGWRLNIRVGRGGEDIGLLKATVPPELDGPNALLGLTFRPSPLAAARLAVSRAYQMIQAVPQTLAGLLRGQVSGESIIGPIGIAQLTGEVVERHGYITLLELVAFLSLNLAVINLIPFPALDGGRLLFVLLEGLRGGRRIDSRKEGLVHLVGMAVLIAIMIMVSYFDLLRIFQGDSILR